MSLTARLAAIKAGDQVTVRLKSEHSGEFEISGKAYERHGSLNVGQRLLRTSSGAASLNLVAVVEHVPTHPAPEGDVLIRAHYSRPVGPGPLRLYRRNAFDSHLWVPWSAPRVSVGLTWDELLEELAYHGAVPKVYRAES